MDIKVPARPPKELTPDIMGPHPWERPGYAPVEHPEDVHPDDASDGYHVLRRDISWLREEVREALVGGNAMRLRELLELFVWGQDLRRAYDGPVRQATTPATATPEPPEAPAAPATPSKVKPKPKLSHNSRYNKRLKRTDDWEI